MQQVFFDLLVLDCVGVIKPQLNPVVHGWTNRRNDAMKPLCVFSCTLKLMKNCIDAFWHHFLNYPLI